MNQPNNSFGELLADAFPGRVVSSELVARVAAMTQRPRSAPRMFRFICLGAMAAAAVFGGITLAPRASAFALLSRIQNAAESLPEWHVVIYSHATTGADLKVGETWCRNGHVRDEEDRGRHLVFADDKEEIDYVRGEDHAVRGPSRHQGHEIQTLSAFLHEMKSSAWMTGVSVERNVVEQGRRATRITALSKTEPTRITMYADSATDVPFRLTVEVQRSGGWQLLRWINVDTSPVSEATVKLDLPAGVTILDQAALRRTWEDKLSKPIATYSGAFAPLEVRSVWMNEDGVIFVMYTNGHSNRPADTSDWETLKGPNGQTIKRSRHPVSPQQPWLTLDEVSDDVGAEYKPIDGFQGVTYFSDGRLVGGLQWGKEDAQVAVFAPMKVPAAAAHRIKLRFASIMYVVPPGFKPKGKWVTQDEMIPKLNGVAYHTQALTRSQGQQPEWARYIGSSEVGNGFMQALAYARAKAAVQRGDLTEAEAQAREGIRLPELDMAENGQSYLMSGNYEFLGDVLTKEAKWTEAAAAFRKALENARPEDVDKIRLKLRQLHPTPR